MLKHVFNKTQMIYLDNAATTRPDPHVIEIIAGIMENFWGNPSSVHDPGTEAKAIVDESRKTIAQLLGCHADEIIFTSGGTEAINLIFYNIALNRNIHHIITSTLEHPAVLHSIDHYNLSEKTEFVDILPDATPDLSHLENLLAGNPGALVSLMHINNECGSIADIAAIAELCSRYGALLFSDTVQSIGKTQLDFSKTNIDFAACSAHKYHGPRGIGFLFKRRKHQFIPQTVGGGQESGLRSGTENTAAIAGMCKALEIAVEHLPQTESRIGEMKTKLISLLRNSVPDIQFVGNSDQTIPHIISIAIPDTEENSILTEQLNAEGFSVSAGSACHATTKRSTLLSTIGLTGYFPLRVSFGRFTTSKETEEFAKTFSRLYVKGKS
jgi:cysteine desulfurase